MKFNPQKQRVLRYEDFSSELGENSPLKRWARHSKKIAETYFFVYAGNIKQDKVVLSPAIYYLFPLLYRLTLADGSTVRPIPYPVIFGDIEADEIYFHGYVEGNVSARNMYSEKYYGISTASGCGGNLGVSDVFLLHRENFVACENFSINTLILTYNGKFLPVQPSGTIRKTFNFPSSDRKIIWENHKIEELKNWFADSSIPNIEQFYGKYIDAMLPMMPGICETKSPSRYWLRNHAA
jgi:hypothetical protein